MQFAAPTDDETIAALDQLKRSIRIAFCGVMQSTPGLLCADHGAREGLGQLSERGAALPT